MARTNTLIAAPHLREPWGHEGDHRILIHTKLDQLKGTAPYPKERLSEKAEQIARYDAAKRKNDIVAAVELVKRAVDPRKVAAIVEAVNKVGIKPIVVFPHPAFADAELDGHIPAEQGRVTNAIPFAFAAYVAEMCGGTLNESIVQAARVGRTELTQFTRFLWQPKFDGAVSPRMPYIIVDDTTTIGGTFAALRGYVVRNGGTVIAHTALAHTQGVDVTLAVSADTLLALSDVYGDGLGEYWKGELGHAIFCITEQEAQRLLTFGKSCEGADATGRLQSLRERVAKAAATGK